MVHGTAQTRKKFPQIAAVLLIICVISVSLFPALFLVIHVDHNCVSTIDMECRFCVIIFNAVNLLKQINRYAAFAFFTFAALLTFSVLSKLNEVRIYPAALLDYKIRLNT